MEQSAHVKIGKLAHPDPNINFTSIRATLATQATLPAPAAFATSVASAKTVYDIIQAYEVILEPIRRLNRKKEIAELEMFHLKDQIKLASKLKPGELEKKKSALITVKKEVDTLTKAMADASNASFTTASLNDFLNVLRVMSHTRDDAQTLASMVLDEMTRLCHIPLNAESQLLARNVIFGDGPAEDSGVLFSLVEMPERGEVSVSRKTVEKIADDALKTISQRHETPITEGVLLRKLDTFPMLQRSSE